MKTIIYYGELALAPVYFLGSFCIGIIVSFQEAGADTLQAIAAIKQKYRK